MRTKEYLITSIFRGKVSGFIFKSEDKAIFHFTDVETKAILENLDDEYGRYLRYDILISIRDKLPFTLNIPVPEDEVEKEDSRIVKQTFIIDSVTSNGYGGFILTIGNYQKLNVSIGTFNTILTLQGIAVDETKCITIEDVKKMLPLTIKIPFFLALASNCVYDVRPTRAVTVIDYWIQDNININVVDSELNAYELTQQSVKEMFPFIKNLKLELRKQLPFQIFIKKMF